MTNTTAQAEALLAAASGECSPCTDGPCFVQPCGYHCKYPYTDDSKMWAENCPDCRKRREARNVLAAGAPEVLAVAIAAMKALEAADAKLGGHWARWHLWLS